MHIVKFPQILSREQEEPQPIQLPPIRPRTADLYRDETRRPGTEGRHHPGPQEGQGHQVRQDTGR